MNEPEVSRRGFVRGAAAVGAFVALDAIGAVGVARGSEPRSKPTVLAEGVIFPDPTLCIGCLTCEVICSRVHREQGLSVLLVEQNANLAVEIAHRVYLLETGRFVASGTAEQISSDDSIRKAYLGY